MTDQPEELPDELKRFIEENGMPEGARVSKTWTPTVTNTANAAQITWAPQPADVEPEAPEDEDPLSAGAEARIDLLAKAAMIVTQDRNNQYGEPEDSFGKIGALWGTYLGLQDPVHPGDVAVMMILLKVARLSNDITNADTWIDVAGYAACGGAVFVAPDEEQE